jgi:hypothetical protein
MKRVDLIATLTPAGNGSHQEAARALRQIIEPGGAVIANPTGGATTDAEARAAIVAILGALRTKGIIAT